MFLGWGALNFSCLFPNEQSCTTAVAEEQWRATCERVAQFIGEQLLHTLSFGEESTNPRALCQRKYFSEFSFWHKSSPLFVPHRNHRSFILHQAFGMTGGCFGLGQACALPRITRSASFCVCVYAGLLFLANACLTMWLNVAAGVLSTH